MIFSTSLIEEKEQAILPVLYQAGLPFALLFGSAGRGQPFHDLDVPSPEPAICTVSWNWVWTWNEPPASP